MQPHIENFLKDIYKPKDSLYSVYANLNKIPIVDVLSGHFISFIAQITKPKNCLEIGCGVGVSMEYIMEAHTIEKYIALDTNIERLNICKDKYKNKSNIEFYNIDGEVFLKSTIEKYDFIFVDSIKNRYSIMWHYIKKRMNKNSLVIFDDVLLYGLLGQNRSVIPDKYNYTSDELKGFIREISCDKIYQSFIIPIGNGLLLIKNVG